MKQYDEKMKSDLINKDKFKYCIEFSEFIIDYLE